MVDMVEDAGESEKHDIQLVVVKNGGHGGGRW